MSIRHKEAPFTCDPEDVAEAVAKNLRTGPITCGSPAATHPDERLAARAPARVPQGLKMR